MTSFRITGLSAEPFRPLFALSDEELASRHILRRRAGPQSRFPDRVALRFARPGESCLLLNHCHLDMDSPYRASHAIYVREQAEAEPFDAVDTVPEILRTSLLSLRAFDAQGLIVAADMAEGATLEPRIEEFLARSEVAFVHAHFARHGCYAARITRA